MSYRNWFGFNLFSYQDMLVSIITIYLVWATVMGPRTGNITTLFFACNDVLTRPSFDLSWQKDCVFLLGLFDCIFLTNTVNCKYMYTDYIYMYVLNKEWLIYPPSAGFINTSWSSVAQHPAAPINRTYMYYTGVTHM